MSKDERIEANKVKEKKLEANLPSRYFLRENGKLSERNDWIF